MRITADLVPAHMKRTVDTVILEYCVGLGIFLREWIAVQAVMAEELKEIQASVSDPEGSQQGDDKPVKRTAATNNVQPLRPKITVGDGDSRLQALEKKVDELEKIMRRDNKRFQRMLMMLALSDDGDEEILDALKDQDKIDKI